MGRVERAVRPVHIRLRTCFTHIEMGGGDWAWHKEEELSKSKRKSIQSVRRTLHRRFGPLDETSAVGKEDFRLKKDLDSDIEKVGSDNFCRTHSAVITHTFLSLIRCYAWKTKAELHFSPHFFFFYFLSFVSFLSGTINTTQRREGVCVR
jgi:hypothetical protein